MCPCVKVEGLRDLDRFQGSVIGTGSSPIQEVRGVLSSLEQAAKLRPAIGMNVIQCVNLLICTY